MTEDRKYFNDAVLPNFIKNYVKIGDVVIDIGKPNDGWGYRSLFEGCDYRTLDRVADLNPDILDDLENTKLEEGICDCFVCQGVMEQCSNPFKLVDGVKRILKFGGFGLFAIMSVGFPMIQDLDLCRFTPQGVLMLLKNFSLVEFNVKKSNGVPTTVYVIVRKDVI